MTLLTSLVTFPALETLAWTLVHFLWQGTLLALAAAAILRWGAVSPAARYVTGVVTLAAMLVAPVATFFALGTASSGSPTSIADTQVGIAVIEVVAADLPVRFSWQPLLLTLIVGLWMGGVIALSIRLLGGWIVARRLATAAAEPASRHLEDLAARVAARLNLQQAVRIAESASVAVPVVVGWIRPMIVVPAAALGGLAPAHVEALLAHELAHVQRRDYLVNLLQSAVETLLFYHPGVWWVSRRVRIEREHCCDDLAVTVCDRVEYVHALTNLAARTAHARLALAATDGSLVGRVRRLLSGDPDERHNAGWLAVGLIALLAASLAPALAVGAGEQAATTSTPTPAAAAPAPAPRASAVPTTMPPAVAPVVSPDAQATVTIQTAPASPTTAEQARRNAERAALAEQIAAVEAELSAVRQRRRAAEVQQAQQEHQLRIQAAAERVAALEKELAAAARRQEIGVANGEAVDAVRAQVADARRELQRAEAERTFVQITQELEARQDELMAAHGRLQQRMAAEAARAETPAVAAPRAVPAPARTTAPAEAPRRATPVVAPAERAPAATPRSSASPAVASPAARNAAAAAAATPQIHKVGDGIKPPAMLKRVEPEYPLLAKAAKQQGPVYISAIVGTDGHVREAEVTGGAPFPALHEAALAAVRQWQYAPTLVDGVPVEVQLSMQVFFKLNGGPDDVPVTDPGALIQRGDVLQITIEGENELPRTYRVSADGTIRLPLVGTIGLVDITAAQARDWIRKMLTDRQLAPGGAVSVTIRRPQLVR
jgi:TonB family protein